MPNLLLDAALDYLARGWSVIPIVPGDKKALVAWKAYQTRRADAAEIQEWWRLNPTASPGIVTGAISNLVVADADVPDGETSLIACGGMAQLTPQARTPRGGRHMYFAHPGGVVRNFARKLPGLDLRGDGGYVVAPPSAGANGRAYEWLVPIDMADPVAMPPGLIALLSAPPPAAAAVSSNGHAPLARATLEYLAFGAPVGSRNDRLYRAAQQFFAAGYSIDEARAQLVNRARQDGLADDEIESTITSGYQSTIVTAPAAPPPSQPPPSPPPAAAQPGAPQPPPNPGRFFQGKTFVPTLLARDMLAKRPYIYVAEQLWRYEHGVYLPDGEGVLKQDIVNALDSAWRAQHAAQVIEWITTQTRRAGEAVNLHPGVINVQNGMLDLATLTLQPHDPAYASLTQLPVVYDPNADTAIIEQFVTAILAADALDAFWECVAAAFLYGRYSPKIFCLLVGPKDSGKSKLLELLIRFYGTSNVSHVTFQALADNRFAHINLYGMLANIFSDLSEAEAQDAGRIKGLTGDDVFSAERKYKGMFSFKNLARLWFSANHYPTVRAPDEAFFARALIFYCGHVFAADDPTTDPAIIATLSAPDALSGMLLLVIAGWRRLVANREQLSPSPSIEAQRELYRMEADSITGFMESRSVADGPGERTAIPRDRWYRAYSNATKAGGKQPHNDAKFFRRMADLLSRYGLITEYTTKYEGAPAHNQDQRWCYVGRKIIDLDLL